MPCSRRNAFCGAQYKGGVAQLGERVNGIHEVRGSIPLASIEKQEMGKVEEVREVGAGWWAGPLSHYIQRTRE
jgi:hypothetical protein